MFKRARRSRELAKKQRARDDDVTGRGLVKTGLEAADDELTPGHTDCAVQYRNNTNKDGPTLGSRERCCHSS